MPGPAGKPGKPGRPGERGICPKYCAEDGGVFFEDGTTPNAARVFVWGDATKQSVTHCMSAFFQSLKLYFSQIKQLISLVFEKLLHKAVSFCHE
ncbi:unnamed protein product [Cylicostephanus goldi]|uniref:Uncharacterized protein n=1 Tax=Cylicostephanus goldi TaxID=71465 RepID=A0A3P7QK67_CYLGO|nr:unnamed protein product [Cylicostephanus goldi]